MSLVPIPVSLVLFVFKLLNFKTVLSQVTPKVNETASVTLEAVTGKQSKKNTHQTSEARA